MRVYSSGGRYAAPMRACAICISLLIGAGASSLPAADVSTPPVSRSITIRVRVDEVANVFGAFAAAAARVGLRCHAWSMVGYRESFCDLGSDVSVVGIRAAEPPGVAFEGLSLEVHAIGHGSERDKALAGIGDRMIDQIESALKGNPGVDKVVACTESKACCALLNPYMGCVLPVSNSSSEKQ